MNKIKVLSIFLLSVTKIMSCGLCCLYTNEDAPESVEVPPMQGQQAVQPEVADELDFTKLFNDIIIHAWTSPDQSSKNVADLIIQKARKYMREVTQVSRVQGLVQKRQNRHIDLDNPNDQITMAQCRLYMLQCAYKNITTCLIKVSDIEDPIMLSPINNALEILIHSWSRINDMFTRLLDIDLQLDVEVEFIVAPFGYEFSDKGKEYTVPEGVYENLRDNHGFVPFLFGHDPQKMCGIITRFDIKEVHGQTCCVGYARVDWTKFRKFAIAECPECDPKNWDGKGRIVKTLGTSRGIELCSLGEDWFKENWLLVEFSAGHNPVCKGTIGGIQITGFSV